MPKVTVDNLASLSRSISGSIVTPSVEDSEGLAFAVYSWGPAASHTFHDDSKSRTVDESLISPMNRAGRLSGIVSVACGPNHSAYATNQGEVYTCGNNISGAVEPFRRDITELIRPTLVEGLVNNVVLQISCGFDHTAAVTSTGSVLTWGSNDMGQLGHFIPCTDENIPVSFCRPKTMILGSGTKAASVACGDKFTLVLTTRMAVLVCGVANIAGYTSESSAATTAFQLPRELPTLVGLPLASISAGKDHAVVLTSHGSAYAWGKNDSGCFGRPYPRESNSPLPILMPSSQLETPLGSAPFPNWAKWDNEAVISLASDVAIVHAACGYSHTVLVTRSGQLMVCGLNDNGQLGVSGKNEVQNTECVQHPEKGRRFVCAEAGNKNTLLLDDCGDVWQMGSETAGILKRVISGKNVITIATSGLVNAAVSAAGGTTRQFSLITDECSDAETARDIARNLESLVERISSEMEEENAELSPCSKDLLNRTETLLRYPTLLNNLFLDPSELSTLYEEVSSIQNQNFQSALSRTCERSILDGLSKLRSENARLIYPESVRCLLHYIQFFKRSEKDGIFDSRGDCVTLLCETLLSLPYEGFKSILAWMALYKRDLFVSMLVHPLLCQLGKALHVDVDENGVHHFQLSRRAAPLIVSVLRWLHRASHRAKIARPEDFYCNAVSKIPLETLYEDLRILKSPTKDKSQNTFLICATPFLIPPSTKRDLLQIESQVNMMKAATHDARLNVLEGEVVINPFFVLEVERDRLMEQTLDKIKQANVVDLRKKLRVKFTGEEGIDAGGVTKEFFQLLSEELFDTNSPLWTRRFGDCVTWFNSDCTWDKEGYELVGVVLGLALYNGVLIDAHFPSALYRKLLNLPLGLEDIVDNELKQGLKFLLDYEGDDVEDVFCLSFELTWSDMGEERKVELKQDGSNIPVSKANREEYVLLYVKWVLVDSIQQQWDSFRTGVMRIIESSSVDLFQPEELELLLVGCPSLDFDALERNAEYEGYEASSSVVRNLWRFLKSVEFDRATKFLKFTTGTSKAPIGGLGSLPFKIQRAGPDSYQLPTSHTCFNTLLIPDYGDNYEKLADRLGRAIDECEGFGLQ